MTVKTALSKTVKVGNEMGLHARPAAQVVYIANRFNADLKLRHTDGRNGEADCRSVLAMLMLAAAKDTVLELSACGEDASAALDAVADYFNRNFDEN
ncbi:MAG: HPr family phosphocarrier protein [Lentisphaeria bacterium]|nr:HPr family phosphocarrier protein [Lentisphaeria bacterium]